MKNPVMIALDVETAAKARTLVESLGDAVSFYKVGLELYAAAGMDFVRELKQQGLGVFLDLKMYDIGETVKRAVAQVAQSGADFLTIHAMQQVMDAAVAGRGESPLKLLGVTVLTSVDDADLVRDGYTRSAEELVDLRARRAMATGVDGLVCSGKDVARVRSITGPRAVLVVPGVRSAGADTADQKRVTTPGGAMHDGASFVVVGRQVTRSNDPRGELSRILDEISVSIS